MHKNITHINKPLPQKITLSPWTNNLAKGLTLNDREASSYRQDLCNHISRIAPNIANCSSTNSNDQQNNNKKIIIFFFILWPIRCHSSHDYHFIIYKTDLVSVFQGTGFRIKNQESRIKNQE